MANILHGVALLCIAIVVIFLIYKVTRWIRQLFIEAHVMKHGIGANADIIALKRTNWMDRRSVYCELVLRFRTREGQVVQASVFQFLDSREIVRFAEGNGTTVKYSPQNPKHIVLYDRPLILGD
ncbi:DUF3592 domain-containing protein [Kosakonia sacchari]|uniref:DUF3592 domain-containing protein n=1 Tax=Kosakonia sacchari TaxID=1158459 RepID=A0A1G4YVY8_9ENTR|nr:DUF3592 domain-containing protein [Kosakonia sacchari]AHJ76945.1 hypothetical protein C813_21170 [Kosakonia sacchari SP1]SCX57576.1 hypothetical protein SAMN02927897_03523 [Kosakonia sacchari]